MDAWRKQDRALESYEAYSRMALDNPSAVIENPERTGGGDHI